MKCLNSRKKIVEEIEKQKNEKFYEKTYAKSHGDRC